MTQRRLRLGDILDDYCPRERRVTNHAVVAIVGDEVKQTRCSTCDADHEYKGAKVPPARRKKLDSALPGESAEGALRPRQLETDELIDEPMSTDSSLPADSIQLPEPDAAVPVESEPDPLTATGDDDGPVHRRLIRATLPRPEGQTPERKEPEFTIRQPGGRGGFDSNRSGQRPLRGPRRAPGGAGPGQPPRFGQGPRHGSGQGQGQGSQGQRPPGNRPGGPGGGGQRGQGGRPGQGPGRPGGGGRKRGR